MMGYALQGTHDYEEMCCGDCGVTFFVPAFLYKALIAQKKTWYCPSGHPRVYSGKNEADRLREQLVAQVRVATEQTARAGRAEQALAVAERATKRLRKRVAAGTCPCCKRTFKQLAAHMSNKHPGYAEK